MSRSIRRTRAVWGNSSDRRDSPHQTFANSPGTRTGSFKPRGSLQAMPSADRRGCPQGTTRSNEKEERPMLLEALRSLRKASQPNQYRYQGTVPKTATIDLTRLRGRVKSPRRFLEIPSRGVAVFLRVVFRGTEVSKQVTINQIRKIWEHEDQSKKSQQNNWERAESRNHRTGFAKLRRWNISE